MATHLVPLLFWSLLAAGTAWWYWGWIGALAAAATVSWLWIFQQIWRAHRLEVWLRAGQLANSPELSGLWRDLGDRMRRLLQLRDQQVQVQADRLQHFLQAIQASPNGVTLLDSQGRIEWCNGTAALHLGLDPQRDHLQHVVHMVRDPVFSRYFSQEKHENEVIIEGRSPSLSKSVKLSVQLHPYGAGQQLFLTRDVTAVHHAESMRRDFVANVSHEIRTPLTVLSGFVETLQSLPLSPDEQQHFLALMAVQASRMQTLVSDLLVLSQLEGSPPPGKGERVLLAPLTQQVMDDALALSALQDIESLGPVHQVILEPVPAWALSGSRDELLSAMSNLANNAVRYTPAGGVIRMAWFRTDDEQVVFSVKDTGPGIAPEHLPRLAERFYRVDRSRSRETGGTGLGLAITKHVAQRHGGQLRIESELGRGSNFMLSFPLSRLET
jgi:two-component system, OmpR family, phosphate regulon sensor histidine kinase PhoR